MKHYHGLDVLRFFAAMMVVGFHLGEFGLSAPVFPAAPDDRAWPWLSQLTSWGWVGVQIFFVISGFVIAASVTGSTASRFLIRRAIRVFPALWVYSCVALFLRLTWGEPSGEVVPTFLRSVVLFPQGPYVDGIIWTLVVEAVFYGFVAVLIARGGVQTPGRLIERGAYLLGAASTVFLLLSILSKHVPVTLAGYDVSALLSRYFFSVLLLRHGVFFAVGMLVWCGREHGFTPVMRRALALFAVMGAVQIGQTCLESGSPLLLTLAVWGGSLAAAYASLDRWRGARSSRQAAALRQIGLMTYPIYLGHFTVGMYLLPMLAPVAASPGQLLAGLLVIIFGLAWMVLRGPERALQAMAKRVFLKPNMAVPADRPAP